MSHNEAQRAHLERKIAHARHVRAQMTSHVGFVRLTRVISTYIDQLNALGGRLPTREAGL